MEPPAQELRSIRDWQGMCWERDLPDWRRDLSMQSELRAPESLQRSGDSRTPLQRGRAKNLVLSSEGQV